MVEANPQQHKKLTVELTTFNFQKKDSEKFQTQEFWSNFFKSKQINANNESTDMESFEWYADFEDLMPHFQDGLIEGENQRIFVPGCGNSLLSEKLCTVMNQTNVTSVDFIPEVVQKMNERNVSGVTYAEMDFLNMTYEDSSFDVVIDKGSFDAICLDDDANSEEKYSKYLSEQVRVLDATSANNKFLIVSLL